ncbi:MAG: AAA family ATPase [Chloroflexi bacterium]|nr:AAA family ATPase [Chloroflexota bacterium]
MPASTASRDETIRLVIASDSRERAQELTVLLGQTFVPIEVIAQAQTRQTMQMGRDFQPHVILFVDDKADVPVTEVCRSVYQSLPGTAVIVLTPPAQQENVQYLRQAMLAGARDVLSLPPLLDHLITSIQQAVLQERGRRQPRRARKEGAGDMGKVIVVTGAKGGSGASVIAANLGTMLAQAHADQTVVLFDLDFHYGDQRVLLDMEPTASVLDLLPVIDELTPDAVGSAMITHKSGLRALLAPPELHQADMVEPDMVRKMLVAMRAYYNWVVVDAPGDLSDYELSALDFADKVLIVCTPDVLSIRRTRSMLEVCQGLGLAPAQINLVLNRIRKKDEIKPTEFHTLFNDYVVAAEIPDDPGFVQPRVDRGLPLAQDGDKMPVVKALQQIVSQLTPAPQPTAEHGA